MTQPSVSGHVVPTSGFSSLSCHGVTTLLPAPTTLLQVAHTARLVRGVRAWLQRATSASVPNRHLPLIASKMRHVSKPLVHHAEQGLLHGRSELQEFLRYIVHGVPQLGPASII
jgi:hypothetical protein